VKVGENGGRAVNEIYYVNLSLHPQIISYLHFVCFFSFVLCFFSILTVVHCLHFNFLCFILSWWSLVRGLIFSASFSRGGPWSEVCVFTFINFIFESSLLYSLVVTVLHSLLYLKVFPVSSLCLKVLHSLLLSSLQVSLFEFDLNGWNVNISFAFFSFLFCETNFVIRFKKKRNEFQNPFEKKNMKLYETDFGICFIFFWNGSRIPSLEFFFKICETEFIIRFRKVWNGFQNSFHMFPCLCFMKRILESVSYFSKTDYEFRFKNFKKKFQKRNTWSVSEKYETYSKIRFIKFHVFFSNGFWDLFHTFLKRITYSISGIFKCSFWIF